MNRPTLRKLRWFSLIIVACVFISSSFKFPHICVRYEPPRRNQDNSEPMGCEIPTLDPFRSSIVHMIKEPKHISCEVNFPLLFDSTVNSTIVPVLPIAQLEAKGIQSCCYYGIYRDKESDNSFRSTKECLSLQLENETKVAENHEFVSIDCTYKNGTITSKRFTDMFAFAPLKTTRRDEKYPSPSEKRLSVVIFGIDSVSRANFIREMPQSYKYIMEKMEAIDMEVYNKIGEDTFSSIIPMLTGNTRAHLMSKCVSRSPWNFDKCKFIWSNFSKAGYVTGFAEDAPKMSIFNGIGSGFKKQPTDHYLRTFAIAADMKFGKKQSFMCQGPRLFFQTLLDYMKKVVYRMNQANKLLFYFSWGTSLTHDAINSPMLGDQYLKKTLEWFHEQGQLNSTIFILMSDHGLRWGPIKDTVQGQLEDRLPFMYFVVPKWFPRQYSRAYNNLKENSKRLMTAHDLHYLLNDIVNPEDITNESIEKREKQLQSSYRNDTVPKGISLFLPLPPFRTCNHTLIEANFCVCDKFQEIPKTSSIVKMGAAFVINEINFELEKFMHCAKLSLQTVTMAQQKMNKEKEVTYLINFITTPGQAAFEALVVRGTSSWKLSGSVSRTNKYGQQSSCVNDKNAKQFCYCKKFKNG